MSEFFIKLGRWFFCVVIVPLVCFLIGFIFMWMNAPIWLILAVIIVPITVVAVVFGLIEDEEEKEKKKGNHS